MSAWWFCTEDGKREKTQEQDNFNQKNERSLSEVLTKKDFDKVLPIIEILEEKGCVTPKEALEVCNKSTATVRRYLSMLVEEDSVLAEGSYTYSISIFLSSFAAMLKGWFWFSIRQICLEGISSVSKS